MYEKKLKFLRWLVSLLFGEDVRFTLTRKRWLDELARQTNAYPNSKILTISILRLDGTNFDDALKKYQEINSGK